MNAAQIEKLIVQNSKGLSAEILQEVLDFIEFLKFKKSSVVKDSVQTSLSAFNSSESMHLEEEFSDYKSIYPHEPQHE
jgi:hypothetical protein